MYTEQLKYFMLVGETGSFSAAAKRIPMSPQGLTKSIRALESELDVVLFSVDKTGILALTPYGRELLEFAQKFESDRRVLDESFQRMKANEKREIRLGSSLGIFGLLGPDFLEGFRRKHPEIGIVFNEATDIACDSGLAAGIYDLALTLAPFDRAFETRELYATRMCFWVPVDDELSRRDSIEIEDLAGRTVAMPGKDYKCYTSLLRACGDRGIEIPEIIASAEIFWLYEFALLGKGLGFALEPHLGLPMFQTNDSVRGLVADGLHWRFGVSHMRERKLEPHERTFCEYAVAYTEKLVAQSNGIG